MPYSDPEQKKAYMATYNPKYYGENREPLIRKNTTRKKDLRERKREHILSMFDKSCPHCGGVAAHPIKLYIEYRMADPPQKSVFDLPWTHIELLLNNNYIDVVCSTCKYRGKPADHVGS
jgi:transposase